MKHGLEIPGRLPFLEAICWQIKDVRCFTLSEMLNAYERGWRYRGVLADLEGEELDFVHTLLKEEGLWIPKMFTENYNQNVVTVLNALKADFFTEISAYFGGGTLLTLLYDEYRVSKDIDFICPVGPGYRRLRSEIYDHGYQAFFKDSSDISLPREIRADQYGVRFFVGVEDIRIKFEIVAEARIALEPPEFYEWSEIPCLSLTDCWAEKLLSNSDRWADTALKSRDLIDLAVLRLHSEIPSLGLEKAESAYPVKRPLKKAVKKFQTESRYRNECFSALQVKNRAEVMNGIDLLASDYDISLTKRRYDEEPS